MPAYFDSSFLLAAILGQAGGDAAAAKWDSEDTRVGSLLLEAECLTVIRRVAEGLNAQHASEYVAGKTTTLRKHLQEVSLKYVDDEVISRLYREPRLGGCRTLDALHLATALVFQDHSEEAITVCTNDANMRKTAEILGFQVLSVNG